MNGKSFIWKTVPCYIMPCKRLKVEGVRMKKSMRSSVSRRYFSESRTYSDILHIGKMKKAALVEILICKRKEKQSSRILLTQKSTHWNPRVSIRQAPKS